MMLGAFVEGLQSLQKYYDKDSYNVGAEHEIFYAYATDRPVSNDDVARLAELQWFQPDVNTGEEHFQLKHYKSNEGWAAYV